MVGVGRVWREGDRVRGMDGAKKMDKGGSKDICSEKLTIGRKNVGYKDSVPSNKPPPSNKCPIESKFESVLMRQALKLRILNTPPLPLFSKVHIK